jgi:hypothetical protein
MIQAEWRRAAGVERGATAKPARPDFFTADTAPAVSGRETRPG